MMPSPCSTNSTIRERRAAVGDEIGGAGQRAALAPACATVALPDHRPRLDSRRVGVELPLRCTLSAASSAARAAASGSCTLTLAMFACPALEPTFTVRLAPLALLVFACVDDAVNVGLNGKASRSWPRRTGSTRRRSSPCAQVIVAAIACCEQLVGLNMNPGRSIVTLTVLHAQRHAVDDLRQRIADDRQRARVRVHVDRARARSRSRG